MIAEQTNVEQLQAEIATLKQQLASRWIDVNDALPDVGELVEVMLPNRMAWRRKAHRHSMAVGMGWKLVDGDCLWPQEVAMWRPLTK